MWLVCFALLRLVGLELLGCWMMFRWILIVVLFCSFVVGICVCCLLVLSLVAVCS